MRKSLYLTGMLMLSFFLSRGVAFAQDEEKKWYDMVDFQGYLESDLRFIVDDWRGPTDGDGYKFQMNRNDLDLRLGITPFETVRAVVDTRLRMYGFSEADTMQGLNKRETVDPFAIYLDEAYVHVQGLGWEGMDLKVGRMVQNWGTVDQFNPTDNVSARDLSDPLDSFAKVPNQMIEIDLYPADWLTLNFIWVPVFKPSMLPPSANLGFAIGYDENGCFKDLPTPPMKIEYMEELMNMFGAIDPCSLNFVDPEMQIVSPDLKIENSQAAAKAKFLVGPLDFSLSYYYGRWSFPVPATGYAGVDNNAEDPNMLDVKYIVELTYPRIHVAGFDFSYSADWFFDVGFVGEVAVFFPEKVDFALRAFQNGNLIIDKVNNNVPTTPFVKATGGFDYTFTSWLYLNAMYVRGFLDEFNDMYGIHNYVVMAWELKFLEDELQFRIAGIFGPDDMSGSFQPRITWVVVPSVELFLQGQFYFGDEDSNNPLDFKAKDKLAWKPVGRNIVALKAKVSW